MVYTVGKVLCVNILEAAEFGLWSLAVTECFAKNTVYIFDI